MNYEVCIIFNDMSARGPEDMRAQFTVFGSVAPLRGADAFTVTTRVRLFADEAQAAARAAGGTIQWVRSYPDRT